MKDVHNNAELANQLSDLLREFSIETQKQFEQISGIIEQGRRNELLEETVYEEIMVTGGFDTAYTELVERNCMDLSTRMQAYLDDLSKKMIEYNSITI